MESSSDKAWAKEYLLDPLNAPEPSQEDGPGSSFRPGSKPAPVSPPHRQQSGRRLSKTNPLRNSSGADIKTTEIRRSTSLHSHGGLPSPPPSASPRGRNSPRSPNYRQDAFGEEKAGVGRRRGSSLGERYPGDMSHRPLDTLAREKATADRSRHATKKHHIQPDIIDGLDNTGGAPWHHGGPYDATLFARNNTKNSPLDALRESNAEALKATPPEKVIDSLKGHRPLDGTAAYAPGDVDRNGNVYNYREGENMMIDGDPAGGAYKRWPGVQYHPDDIKGKGEPSYTIEKAIKDKKMSDEKDAPGGNEFEMKNRHRSTSGADRSGWDDGEGQLGRSDSITKRLSGGLKRRFGSIKRQSKEQ